MPAVSTDAVIQGGAACLKAALPGAHTSRVPLPTCGLLCARNHLVCSSPLASPGPIASAGSTAYALGIAFGMFSATEWTPEHITDLMPVGAFPAWYVWYASPIATLQRCSTMLQSGTLSWHLPAKFHADYVTNGIIMAAAAEPTKKVRSRELGKQWLGELPYMGACCAPRPTGLVETCRRVHPLVKCLGTTRLPAPLCLRRMRRRWSCRPPPQRWTPCATSR